MIKKIILPIILLASLCSSAQEYEYNYTFFTNSMMPDNYFYSKAMSSGHAEISNLNGKLPINDDLFHTPGNCLELDFTNDPGGEWKAIIFHHEIRGRDHFKKAAKLSFWLYAPVENASGGRYLPKVQLMKRDSSLTSPVHLDPFDPGKWKQQTIDLGDFGNVDMTHPESVIGVLFAQGDTTSGNFVLFVDDMEFLPDQPAGALYQSPVIKSAEGYAVHVDIQWEKVLDPGVHMVKIYRSENGKMLEPVGIQMPYMDRYADFTGESGKNYSYRISFLNSDYEESEMSEPSGASTRSLTDDELLSMVQQACFRYYWEGVEQVSGMARENIPGRHNMVATGASGFGIMALIAGTERHFITREESVSRFTQILDFLEKADRFHGVYGHFMDGPTGRVEPFFGRRDNGADLVETAFLMQGLLAARQYFSGDNTEEKMIREKITRLWEDVEWDWFRKDPGGDFLYWHWSPDQAWVIDHRLIGWNETMVVYLLAIASPTHPVPASIYYSGWASQDKIAQKYRSSWGQSDDGSMYTNGRSYYGINLDVGVNNGGPLFFTHYSYMGYDPHFITDIYTNYFHNNRNIARINHEYCVANPKGYQGYGENGWGLTASDGPFDYSADEPVEWQDHGKLTPTGAIASFPYTPEESMKALKNYYYHCGQFLWGEYGFRDAFNLTDNWCSEIYMGLNQAPMVVMIENYRTGLIWKLFMQDPEIIEGLRKL